MKRFDSWLIEKHEQFAHWFQRLTGLTNFWLAKMTTWAGCTYCLFLFGHIVLEGADENKSMITIVIVLYAVSLQVARHDVKLYHMVELYYLDGADSMHQLTLEWKSEWVYRTIQKLILVQLTISTFGGDTFMEFLPLVYLGLMLQEYFKSCVPLPGGKSKISQFIESLTTRLVPVKATSDSGGG